MIFSYLTLLKKYNIIPKGIIHIGAHHAEECEEYARSKTKNVLWIEGNPELISIIKNNTVVYPKNYTYHALLSDNDDLEIKFKITNETMSSSILDLGTHRKQYPNIHLEKELQLNTIRFDNFVSKNNIEINNFDFVNIDIQGAELLALKGFGELLNNINYIYTEINIDHVYKNCALLDQMDSFLLSKGFNRVELSIPHKSWGDAFYIREKLTENKITRVLEESKKIIKNYKFNKQKKNIFKSLYIHKFYNFYSRFRKKVNPKTLPNKNDRSEYDFLLKFLKQYTQHPKIILFDIGPNTGNYTDILIEHCEALKINYELHLFEPQKKCFDVLVNKYQSNEKIILNNVAISNNSGEEIFFQNEEDSEKSSIYDSTLFKNTNKFSVKTIKIEDYIEAKKINSINFIKIDVEGHELEVLKSTKKYFNIIENIQFEYGGTFLDSKCTLKEVFAFLKEYFYIGKIESESVSFTPFTNDLEDYKYSKYIAENKKLILNPIDYTILK